MSAAAAKPSNSSEPADVRARFDAARRRPPSSALRWRPRCFERRPQRRDHGDDDAKLRQTRPARAAAARASARRLERTRRRDRRRARASPTRAIATPDGDARKRADEAQERAAGEHRRELLRPRVKPSACSMANSRRRLRASSGLRRVDEEAAREQRDERERSQIGSIRARQAQSVVARIAWRDDARLRRQQRLQCAHALARRSRPEASRTSIRDRRPSAIESHAARKRCRSRPHVSQRRGRQNARDLKRMRSRPTCTRAHRPAPARARARRASSGTRRRVASGEPVGLRSGKVASAGWSGASGKHRGRAA